jgi:hypothetical protein
MWRVRRRLAKKKRRGFPLTSSHSAFAFLMGEPILVAAIELLNRLLSLAMRRI